MNRIGLWLLLREDFLRETSFKANCRDFGRHGKEFYVGVCTFGNKENIQEGRRKRSRYLKLVSLKTKKLHRGKQANLLEWTEECLFAGTTDAQTSWRGPLRLPG